MTRISDTKRRQLYGPVVTHGDDGGLGVASSELRLITLPWGMRVQCHRLLVDVMREACWQADAHSGWKPQRVDSFAPRLIRGGSSMSLHAFGLAFDFFATLPGVPPPGGVWTPDNGVSLEFAEHFVRAGFTWGATWAREDVPHIEWAGSPPLKIREWDEMATKAEIQAAVREEVDRIKVDIIKEVKAGADKAHDAAHKAVGARDQHWVRTDRDLQAIKARLITGGVDDAVRATLSDIQAKLAAGHPPMRLLIEIEDANLVTDGGDGDVDGEVTEGAPQ